MSTVYIIVLRNNHLVFSEKKPKRKGNYTQDVQLYKTKGDVQCTDICNWVNNEFINDSITEVNNWE